MEKFSFNENQKICKQINFHCQNGKENMKAHELISKIMSVYRFLRMIIQSFSNYYVTNIVTFNILIPTRIKKEIISLYNPEPV